MLKTLLKKELALMLISSVFLNFNCNISQKIGKKKYVNEIVIVDSLLIKYVKDFKKKEFVNDSNSIIVISIKNSKNYDKKFYLSYIMNLSDIYTHPFSSYFFIDNKPVLLYFNNEGFIHPDSINNILRDFFSQFLFDDLAVDSIAEDKISGIKGFISYDSPVWIIKHNKVKKYTYFKKEFLPYYIDGSYYYINTPSDRRSLQKSKNKE